MLGNNRITSSEDKNKEYQVFLSDLESKINSLCFLDENGDTFQTIFNITLIDL